MSLSLPQTFSHHTSRLADQLGEAILARGLRSIRKGRLDVTWWDGRRDSFVGPEDGPRVSARINDARFFGRLLRAGEIGLGEAYMDGLFEADDLTSLLALGIVNRSYAPQLLSRINDIARLPGRRLHLTRRNSLVGSRRNIEAHYDLSNELFALFLDETLAYSCAVFQSPEQSLAEAQRHKFDLLCHKSGLRPGDHVLEIGCGWGGFAMHAAAHFGCRVTAVTISQQQLELARRRIAEAGLGGQVTVELRDYRHVEGSFDKIVSIEMFEAVGAEYFETFFRRCDDLLRPGGRLVLQSITVPERTFAALRDGANWLQKYIFPGGMLPSLAQMELAIRRTALVIADAEDVAQHYVRTLQEWRRAFLGRLDAVRALGFDERFIRMWQYYLSYCEAGFLTRSAGDLQVVFEKPA